MKLKMWLHLVLNFFDFNENVFWKQFIERHWLFIYNIITICLRRGYRWMCARRYRVEHYAIRQWRVRGKSTWTGPITGRLPRCEKMLSHSRNIHKNIYVGIDVTQPLHTMCCVSHAVCPHRSVFFSNIPDRIYHDTHYNIAHSAKNRENILLISQKSENCFLNMAQLCTTAAGQSNYGFR